MKNTVALGFFASALVAFGVSLYFFVIAPPARFNVRLCLPKSPTSALPILADRLGLFATEGIEASITVEDLGRTCVEALLARQIDFAAADVPPVVSALALGNQLAIITELHSSIRYTSLIYPTKGPISAPKDLVGKTVALVKGTGGEILLRLSLKAHQIPFSSVHVIKTDSAPKAIELLEKNNVDAIVLWEPYRSRILTAGLEDYYTTQESPFYTEFSVLISGQELADRHEIVDRTVRALFNAQKFYERDAKQAQNLVTKWLGFPQSEVHPKVWDKIRIGLGLSSVLLEMMTQADLSLTMLDRTPAETSAINIFQDLYPQALRKLDPDLVAYE